MRADVCIFLCLRVWPGRIASGAWLKDPVHETALRPLSHDPFLFSRHSRLWRKQVSCRNICSCLDESGHSLWWLHVFLRFQHVSRCVSTIVWICLDDDPSWQTYFCDGLKSQKSIRIRVCFWERWRSRTCQITHRETHGSRGCSGCEDPGERFKISQAGVLLVRF